MGQKTIKREKLIFRLIHILKFLAIVRLQVQLPLQKIDKNLMSKMENCRTCWASRVADRRDTIPESDLLRINLNKFFIKLNNKQQRQVQEIFMKGNLNPEQDNECCLFQTLLVEENQIGFELSQLLPSPGQTQQMDEKVCVNDLENIRDLLGVHEINNTQLFQSMKRFNSDYEYEQDKLMMRKNSLNTGSSMEVENQNQVIQFDEMQVNNAQEDKQAIKEEKQKVNVNERNIMKYVFQQKQLKGSWKKNTNVPKFIARIFMKYFTYFCEHEEVDALEYHQKITEQFNQRSSNNYSISDILSLLRNQFDPSDRTRKLNQRILAKIINERLTTEVVGNKYIKNHHKTYMIAMKIYALRCRSRVLTERVKIF